MNNDNSFIPIYFKLYERNSKALDQLVRDVETLSKECSIESDVHLAQIGRSEKNDALYTLVYSVNTKPARQRHSTAVGSFLDKVFSQLADKHPAYSEPLNPNLEVTP